MSTTPPPAAPPSPTAAEIAERAALEDEALVLLTDDVEPRAFFERLVEAPLPLDAVRFLAHALPPRSAVWWAWGCAKQAAGEPVPEAMAPALEATRVWLAEPTDARRRAAGKAGNEVDDPGPAALAAMAVFFAEGSTAPPDQPHQAPPPGVAARLAAGAVCLAADADPAAPLEERLDLYLKQGREVARKSGVWAEGDESA